MNKNTLIFILLILLLFSLALFSLSWGRFAIPIENVVQSLMGNNTSDVQNNIIFNLRLPRQGFLFPSGTLLPMPGASFTEPCTVLLGLAPRCCPCTALTQHLRPWSGVSCCTSCGIAAALATTARCLLLRLVCHCCSACGRGPAHPAAPHAARSYRLQPPSPTTHRIQPAVWMRPVPHHPPRTDNGRAREGMHTTMRRKAGPPLVVDRVIRVPGLDTTCWSGERDEC